jgi:hypothetical protein
MNRTMEPEINPQKQTQTTSYRKYEVDSKSCKVELGESVSPETVIGRHFASGQPVQAGIFGQIAAIYFNPMHDSLLILAVI